MENYLEMRHITKVFPNGIVANNDACLSVRAGEIHALAGENGAGKSTLMRVLYGAESAEGEILLGGKSVRITSPRIANQLGIGMVYQHFMLVKEFTVCENIFFGIEKTAFGGILKSKDMHEAARELCERYNMPLDLDTPAGELSVSAAQKVEILKVLARGAKLLILDEPTAVLTPQETEQLFAQLRLLKESGYTIIIITHKLKEIKELCDRITVMRDGRTVGVYNVADVTEEEISALMVGRNINLTVEKSPAKPGEEVLRVEDLSVAGRGSRKAVDGVSFSVRKGEILCIAGVEGNGQRETVSAICGMRKPSAGRVLFMGQEVAGRSRKALRRAGMSHIPEDRNQTGCDRAASIYENMISLDFAENCRMGFINNRALRARSREWIGKYTVKGDLDTAIGSLSGGNVQKVIVARELEADPVMVLADQPTRGVDVGAIEIIHKKLVEMRDQGKAILLVSADLAEVFALADRILVFHEGQITAEIDDPASTTEMQLGRYMLGLERKA